jgi:hypothetical protein
MAPRSFIRLFAIALAFGGIPAFPRYCRAADSPLISSAAAASAHGPSDESLSRLAQQTVLESIPRHFEEKKNWGNTTKIVNGLRLQNDGDGLKIRKHTKEVKDGLWKQYDADLIDPEHQLQVRVDKMHKTDSGHTAFQIFISARLRGEARLEQWKDGIKLFNVDAQAESKIETRLDCEMAVDWKAGGVLGQFQVEPKVTAAHIDLADFELKKLSKIEGWPAREIGENLKSTISRRLHAEEPKLVEKANKAIAKRQEKLRFSPDDIVAGGLSKLQSLFGSGEKTATEK